MLHVSVAVWVESTTSMCLVMCAMFVWVRKRALEFSTQL